MKKIDDYQEVEDLERDIEIIEEFVDISDSLIELEKNRDLIIIFNFNLNKGIFRFHFFKSKFFHPFF